MSGSSSVRVCGALGLGLLLTAPAHGAEPASLRVHVVWQGACDDPAALVAETRSRGVELVDAAAAADGTGGGAPLSLRVGVARQGTGLIAELELDDQRGARDARRVQTQSCAELRQGVAWVLVTLAKERRFPSSFGASGGAIASFPELAPEPAPERPRSRPSTPPSPPAVPRPLLESTPSPAVRPAESRLGSALIAGYGFAPGPAVGPLLFIEHAPSVAGAPALRLSAFQLSSFAFESQGTTISVERLAARLSGSFAVGWKPLRVAASVEAGRLLGSGSGAVLRQRATDTELWCAVGLSTQVELPLVSGVLGFEAGLGVDYTPLEYSFGYGSLREELSHSEPFEIRGQIGLSTRL